jgi:ABC-type phosphate/phosphonate transport system permease subunit
MKISLSLHKIYYYRASLRQDLPRKTPTDKSNAIKTVIHFLQFLFFIFTFIKIKTWFLFISFCVDKYHWAHREWVHPSYRQIQCNKDSYTFSFFCQTIKDWNKLSPDITKNTTTESFKGALTHDVLPGKMFSNL